MTLTKKELMLLQDNIKMTQNSVKFMQGCTEICSDSEVKDLCQRMAVDHQKDIQVFTKFINTAAMQ